MSSSAVLLPRGYRYPQNAGWASFAGGLNDRDSPSELGPADVEQAFNISFDERGGAPARLGFTAFFGPYVANRNIICLYWSPLLNTWLALTSQGILYKGSSTTSTHTFTTTDPVTFAELNGKVYVGHPVDGLFSSPDGVTWTAVASANRPTTIQALATWQNKLWAVPFNSNRVQWSDPGDGTAWSLNAWVDVREKDDAPLIALHIGSGQDILGRPGLFAFKQDSGYRIHDASTGAYETVDANAGCASARAVVGVGGFVYTLCRRGIFRWQAGRLGAVNMGDKLAPLWDPSQIDLTKMSLWAAGRYKNRALFSLTRLGATSNNVVVELHTEQGWLTTHGNSMSCYMTSVGSEEQTYGGGTIGIGGDRLYQLYNGGTDKGTAIAFVLQTRWLPLLGGFAAMVQQIKLRGRGGPFTLEVRTDYANTGVKRTIDFTPPTLAAPTGLAAVFNLIPQLDASLEGGVGDWTPFGGATLAVDSSDARFGHSSLAITPSAAGDGAALVVSGLSLGQTYTFSAYIKGAVGDALKINVFDGGFVGTAIAGDGTWQRISWTQTLAVTASPTVVFNTGSTAKFRIDGIQVEKGSTASPFVDGGSLPSGAIVYEVTAVDQHGGESVASAEVTANPVGPNGAVALSWNPVAGAAMYRLYFGSGSGLESQYFETVAPSFTDVAHPGGSIGGTPPAASTATSEEVTITVPVMVAAKQLSLVLYGTTSGTHGGPGVAIPIGGGTAGPTVGAFALFSAEAMFTRLGIG